MNNNNYLCILLRARFTLWYRFGSITLGNNELIPFNGMIGEAEKEAIQLRFKQQPFEYDEEYLIFHLTNGQNSGNETIFSVHDIAAIYPLSAQAKQSIAQKSDQRIHFAEPFFTPSELENFTRILDFNERMAGVRALWQSVFGAEADIKPYLAKLSAHLQKAVANRAAGLKCAQIEDGHYLEYLFAYDRTAHFSNNKSGYFQDAITILFHYQQKNKPENRGQYFPDENVEKSTTFQFIQSLPKEYSFTQLFEQVGQQASYADKVNNIDGINYHYVTPLFLRLKKEIQDANGCHNTSLTNNEFLNQSTQEPYCEHFRYVIILLGLFFSYKYVYDFYYEKSHLRIFQTKPESHSTIQEPLSNDKGSVITNTNKRKPSTIKEDPTARQKALRSIIDTHFAGNEKPPLKISEVKKRLKEAGFSDRHVEKDFEQLKNDLPSIVLKKQSRTKVFMGDRQGELFN